MKLLSVYFNDELIGTFEAEFIPEKVLVMRSDVDEDGADLHLYLYKDAG